MLALAVLPRLRVGGRQLLEHEMPGPDRDAEHAHPRHCAHRVWVLYIALTAACFAILLGLWATGVDERMSPFMRSRTR